MNDQISAGFGSMMIIFIISLLLILAFDLLMMKVFIPRISKTSWGERVSEYYKTEKGKKNIRRLISVLVFIVTFIIISIFNYEKVIYNNYNWLADAILKGRIDIPDLPAYLEPAVSKLNGMTYMHLAPGPTIFVLPLVAVFGRDVDTAVLSILLAACNAVVFYNILERLGFKKINTKLWLTGLFVFGTVQFWLAVLARSWFYGHICTTLFLLIPIWILLNKKSKYPNLTLVLAGLSFGFAATCRLPVLLAAPIFILLILFHRKQSVKGLLLFGLGVFIPGSVYIYYNWVRYGTIMDQGYYLRFETDRPGQTGGPLQTKYIGYNLYSFFLMAPKYIGQFPYVIPYAAGQAVTFTTPAAYFALRAKGKWYLIAGLWVSIVLAAIPFLMNYGNGWVQFGMRYSMDFLPLIMILAAIGLRGGKDKELSILKKLLILLCIFVNGWGCIFWRAGLDKIDNFL